MMGAPGSAIGWPNLGEGSFGDRSSSGHRKILGGNPTCFNSRSRAVHSDSISTTPTSRHAWWRKLIHFQSAAFVAKPRVICRGIHDMLWPATESRSLARLGGLVMTNKKRRSAARANCRFLGCARNDTRTKNPHPPKVCGEQQALPDAAGSG